MIHSSIEIRVQIVLSLAIYDQTESCFENMCIHVSQTWSNLSNKVYFLSEAVITVEYEAPSGLLTIANMLI